MGAGSACYKLGGEAGLTWSPRREAVSGRPKGADQEGGVTEKAPPGEPRQAAAKASTWVTCQEGPGVLEAGRERGRSWPG